MKKITIVVNVLTVAGTSEQFLEATKISQAATLKEDGCSRYEILQSIEDENKFTLIETYSGDASIEFHKTTEHFQKWRTDVQPLMAEPRTSHKYNVEETEVVIPKTKTEDREEISEGIVEHQRTRFRKLWALWHGRTKNPDSKEGIN